MTWLLSMLISCANDKLWKSNYQSNVKSRTVAARGCLPSGANVFVAPPPIPAIKSPIDILMVTTMALVWTVNITLSWGYNYVMQWNLGWSVATATKKTAALTFCTWLCWNKVMYITLYAESVLQCKCQFARSGQISKFHIFAPPNATPLHSAVRADAPLQLSLSRRHWSRDPNIWMQSQNCMAVCISCQLSEPHIFLLSDAIAKH